MKDREQGLNFLRVWVFMLRWQLPLRFPLFGSTFPKSACPIQALRRLWYFADSQSFCQSENLGSHSAKACDDTFPPQSKHILAKVCQVRSQYRTSNLKTNRWTAPWKFSEWIYRRLRILSRTRSKATQESSEEIYRSLKLDLDPISWVEKCFVQGTIS